MVKEISFSGIRSALISTLGDPSGWDPVEYIYDGSSFKSIFTLPLLNYITPKPDIIIVIVLDTTVEERISSYSDLVEKVRRKYAGFISKETNLSCDQLKIIVAPGAGRFQPRDIFFNFTGNLSDFHAYVMFELSKLLAESDADITIHLDLTHGINFMPSLTLSAIKKIMSILALTRRSAKLKVYNAEPYRKNVTSKLNIHLVEDSLAIIEYDLVRLGAEGKCTPLKRYYRKPVHREEDLRTLISDCDKMKDELNAFLSSVFNGLPLALYTFYPEVDRLGSIIEKIVNIWRENVNVTSNGNEIFVKRLLSFERDFTKLIQIWLIAKTLSLQRKRKVSYEELNSLRDNFFSKFSKKFDVMISRDLNRIKKAVEEGKKLYREWTKLRTVYGDHEKPKDFTSRDFLAHSGLEMNVTEVKYDGQSIMLQYAEDEAKDRVIEGCLDGLMKHSH